MRRALIAVATLAWALPAAGSALAEERSELEWSKADADGIEIYIDTNLPDETPAMLSAVRTYTMMEKGKLTTYSHAYFEEKGPLVNFRLMDRVPTDDAKWARGLKTDLDKWARLGMPSEVRSISENIEVRAYAYARENGRNKLVAKSEVVVQRPLSDAGRVPRRSASIAVDNLRVHRTYRLLGDLHIRHRESRIAHGNSPPPVAARQPADAEVRFDPARPHRARAGQALVRCLQPDRPGQRQPRPRAPPPDHELRDRARPGRRQPGRRHRAQPAAQTHPVTVARGDRPPSRGAGRGGLEGGGVPPAGRHRPSPAADRVPQGRDREPAPVRGPGRCAHAGRQQDGSEKGPAQFAGAADPRTPATDGEPVRVSLAARPVPAARRRPRPHPSLRPTTARSAPRY